MNGASRHSSMSPSLLQFSQIDRGDRNLECDETLSLPNVDSDCAIVSPITRPSSPIPDRERERERGRERERAIEGEQILTFQDVRVNSIIIDFFCLLCLRGLQTYNIQADK